MTDKADSDALRAEEGLSHVTAHDGDVPAPRGGNFSPHTPPPPPPPRRQA